MKKGRELTLMLLIIFLGSCGNDVADFTPKPRGYFRIELPSRDYQPLEIDCPFTFEYNTHAVWQKARRECWGDLYYPDLKGRLQLTYKPVSDQNLETLLEEGRQLAFKHTVKAAGIGEKVFNDPYSEVYGILYNIQGEAATNIQFFMTDSANHFLRGGMYFYAEPNVDSLRPVNDYMQGEIVHLIETLQWKNLSP